MSSYYLRYTADAQGDLEVGVSFVGYMMYATQEEAIEEHGDRDDLIVFEKRCGKWGRAHSGLCGFGPFVSVEEAEVAIDRNGQYAGYGSVPAAIFEGVDSFDFDIDGSDEGPFFAPLAIAKIIINY